MRTEIEGDQLVTYTADGTFFSSQPAETQTSPNPIPDLPADPDLIPPDPTRLRSPR